MPGPRARTGEGMIGIDNEPLSEVELRELEGVLEQHKGLRGIDHRYGVFTSFCVPRLLATIRHLHQEIEQVTKERDDARALLHNPSG